MGEDSSGKGYAQSDFSVLKDRIKVAVALIPVIEMSGR